MWNEFEMKRRKRDIFRFKSYLFPYIPLIACCIIMALTMNVAILVKPWIIKQVIDEYIATGRSDESTVVMLAFGYLSIVILAAVLQYLQTNFVTLVGQKIMHKIRNDLFAHVQKMSMSFFDHNSSGRLLTRLTNDVEALNDLFSNVLVNIFRDSILLIGVAVMMLKLDILLAVKTFTCVPIIVTSTLIYRHLARKNFIRVKGMIARINGFLAENISGMKLVQIFHREKVKALELDELDNEFVKYSLRDVILHSFSRPVADIINNLTISILIVGFVSGLADSDYGVLKVGVLYAFISYIKQLFEPINDMADQLNSIQNALVSADRILEVFENTEDLEDTKIGIDAEDIKGRIEFKNVWFAYNNDHWVLKDVSFMIEPGETAAFVGTTGSGKTTIINLLSRFYEIQKGVILLEGRDIRNYSIHSLRKNIAVVIQDVFLFSEDIKFNIRLNNKSIDDLKIIEAASYVGADNFIRSLPGSYSELVRERGCTFSSGQRQLISFARAVAFEPSILVLDEATSNIDTETQQIIQTTMPAICSGRTAIIIAHRLSTIRNADVIFVLKDGQIVESGKHEDLLSREGLYKEYFTPQLHMEHI